MVIACEGSVELTCLIVVLNLLMVVSECLSQGLDEESTEYGSVGVQAEHKLVWRLENNLNLQ